MSLKLFNIRTYGILINENKEILISDELYHGQLFSKFPGGGLELGESIPDAIRREFVEECKLKIEEIELLYVTNTVVHSVFNDSQVIGVYYQVFTNDKLEMPIKTRAFDFDEGSEQSFRWISLQDFSTQYLTFEMDQHAWKAIEYKIIHK